MSDFRRTIPRTDAVLADPQLTTAIANYGRARVKAAVVTALSAVRDGKISLDRMVTTVLGTLPAQPRSVINATGVVIHTNLGRAPLAESAKLALVAAAGTTDVEFDLATGQRMRRGRGALAALSELVPDAAGVHVVNNNAAALLLCAMTMATDREIIISRGELVEIGDGFRIPDLLAASGARLHEVGTTNRTSIHDFTNAIGPRTGFILRVHPSNFVISGFSSTPDISDLADLGVPLVVDIGSGLLKAHPLLPDEPDAASTLRAGAHIVTASADKLLGGPQAGLIMGDARLIDQMRRYPIARALRPDKLTYAALEATLRSPDNPVVDALAANPAELYQRAEKITAALIEHNLDAYPIATTAVIGGGAAPGVNLPSAAISLPEHYATALRIGPEPVVGRVRDNRCLLDLRTVPASADNRLIHIVLQCE